MDCDINKCDLKNYLPTYQDSAEVNKRSAREERLQSRGPSYFHLATNMTCAGDLR